MVSINSNELQFDDDQTAIFNGVPFTGVVCYYREDGSKESDVDYVSGVQNGYVRDFDESGNIIFEAEVKNGSYHGQVKHFSEDGTIIKSEKYEFGICISRKELDPTGCMQNVFELRESDPNFKILESMRAAVK